MYTEILGVNIQNAQTEKNSSTIFKGYSLSKTESFY
ncbi:hypothetical protein LCGC14_1655010 [marine sediment metagenome]|uniref:Uncharacterized protein n=1 Tax=marine sediment metagenome TaxID=412755 RepID=A0A0F9IID0_9ZZZZ